MVIVEQILVRNLPPGHQGGATGPRCAASPIRGSRGPRDPRGGGRRCARFDPQSTVAGQIVYADRPCANGAGKQLALPGDSAGLAPQRSYQQQLADIEPARRQRLERERQHDDDRRRLAAAVPDKSMQCAEIDRAVAGIDTILRQPYGPEFGDRKNAERKALMDRRFSIGC